MSTASREWLAGEEPCEGKGHGAGIRVREAARGPGVHSPCLPGGNHPLEVWSSPALPQHCCSLLGYMARDGEPGDTPSSLCTADQGCWGLPKEGQAGGAAAQWDRSLEEPSRMGMGMTMGTGRHMCPQGQIL